MLKSFKQRWGPWICSAFPMDFWHRMLAVEVLLPYYHVVNDNELPHISGLYNFRSRKQFAADMEFFLRYYTPVCLQDVIQYLEGTIQLPKRCFLPTFDDGFREIYDIIAPILLELGVPAVFFLTTSVIDNINLAYPQKKSLLIYAMNSTDDGPIKEEVSGLLTQVGSYGEDLSSKIRGIYYRQRELLDDLGRVLECDFASYVNSTQPYLNSDQISDLIRKGFVIGTHGVDHPLFSELNLDEQLAQIQESINFFSNKYQYKCQAFAFPYTDKGISPEFFQKAFSDERLKVSFGTGGLMRHFFQKNLPRFTMERTDLPAKQILARQFGRAILHRS